MSLHDLMRSRHDQHAMAARNLIGWPVTGFHEEGQ
jgi:hypothetical protein